MPSPTKTTKPPTKFEKTCDYLTLLARQSGPGAKLPTVVQLRATLGVGVNTLNDALAEMEERRLITRKHGSGLFVSPQLSRTIALVCDPVFVQTSGTSPVWQMIVDRVQARAETEHERLELHLARPWGQNEPFNAGLMSELKERQISGVIGIGLTDKAVACLAAVEIPFVSYAGPGPYTVTQESWEVFGQGISVLISRGCKRISIWSPATPGRPTPPSIQLEQEREQWRDIVERCGGQFLPELYWYGLERVPDTLQSHQEQGFHLAKQVFSGPRETWPDGLFIGDDMMAYGVLLALDQLDIRAGIDLPFATQANKGSGILQDRTHLILVENDPATLVDALFNTIERLMNGLEVAVPHQTVPASLKIV